MTEQHSVKRDQAEMGDRLDLSRIEELKTLVGSSRPTFISEILQIFIEETQKYLGALRKGLKEKNPSTVRSASHALKGACANIGAQKMRGFSEQIETQAASGDLEGADHILGNLEHEFDLVKEVLTSLK